MNFNYEMRFAKTGRARYIAHLDMLNMLVRAVRRTGFQLACTQGMRPKPILSLAMPLGVGVEGEDEICDFSLKQRAPLDELAKKLSRELPEGIDLISVGPTFDRSKAAARVDSVAYRISLADPPGELAAAVEQYNRREEFVLTRQRPKGDKEVDIKRYIPALSLGEAGGSLEFDMVVTSEGTGRPEEAIRALEDISGRELTVERVTRTAIRLREEKPQRPPARRRPGSGRTRR